MPTTHRRASSTALCTCATAAPRCSTDALKEAAISPMAISIYGSPISTVLSTPSTRRKLMPTPMESRAMKPCSTPRENGPISSAPTRRKTAAAPTPGTNCMPGCSASMEPLPGIMAGPFRFTSICTPTPATASISTTPENWAEKPSANSITMACSAAIPPALTTAPWTMWASS